MISFKHIEELPLSKWSCEHVAEWLCQQGFSNYSDLLCSLHRIDGLTLLTLTDDDLRLPPIQITVLGDIKRIMNKVKSLRANNPEFIELMANTEIGLTNLYHSSNLHSNETVPASLAVGKQCRGCYHCFLCANSRIVKSFNSHDLSRNCRNSQSFDPEFWKTLLSFLYIFAVFLSTALVMVIVHDRVPDMQRYPPLPDIFLDNMPYVPWAFEACELVGVLLGCIWLGVLFCHKHRFILLRRMFSILGTIFLLRCVTMLITSMSVPGQHLHCVGTRYGDLYSRVLRAFDIWRGFGMSLQGVKSCGDYMFSGHTSIITILNFLITEYTPAMDCYYLHLVSWVLNIFGIFFILAAHEHYSIDVFIAFYISSRLFMYYHTLANNRSLMQRDAHRTRVWFPLFSFFESRCDGRVPNEYEWPFRVPQWLVVSWRRMMDVVGMNEEKSD